MSQAGVLRESMWWSKVFKTMYVLTEFYLKEAQDE